MYSFYQTKLTARKERVGQRERSASEIRNAIVEMYQLPP